ncbi:MAG: hypothetical protein WCT77_09255 [Bacteroidota bacterium]
MSVEKTKIIMPITFFDNNLLQISNYSGYINKPLIRDINYPLMEPIYKIISFIHHTSKIGDDTEVPSVYYLY